MRRALLAILVGAVGNAAGASEASRAALAGRYQLHLETLVRQAPASESVELEMLPDGTARMTRTGKLVLAQWELAEGHVLITSATGHQVKFRLVDRGRMVLVDAWWGDGPELAGSRAWFLRQA
jgi:hypothetical protein